MALDAPLDPFGVAASDVERHVVSAPGASADVGTLRQIERRVLWLATRIIDHANRRGPTDLKVGGHQASSASMVSVMTAAGDVGSMM